MGGRRVMPLPLGTMRFLPGLGARSRSGDEGSPRAVLRAARAAVRVMRDADRAGRRAHAEGDLGRFEVAWRDYQDAVQAYRSAGRRWEALGASRPEAWDDFPAAPPWRSNDLQTEQLLLVVDLAVAEEKSASGDTSR